MLKYCLPFILVLTTVCFGQNQIAPEWQSYVQTQTAKADLFQETQASTSSFIIRFPLGTSKAKLKQAQFVILRWLDQEHAVVALPKGKNTSAYTIRQANNNWKLSQQVNVSNSAKSKTYIVKSTNPIATITEIQKNKKLHLVDQRKNDLYLQGKLIEVKNVLLERTEVHYIGLEALQPLQESTVLDLNPAINNINKVYQQFPNLDGTGSIVSVKDNRFREGDIDLVGKLVTSPLASQTVDGHATDMATIIAGLGNSSVKGRGVAVGVKIQSSDFNSLTPDDASFLSGTDVYIQNHSYGTRIENFYGALASSYDEHIYTNPNELHIFSSGNSGSAVPEEGSVSGLLRQTYVTTNEGNPSAALLKAVLINTADEIGSEGPDFASGYGSVNAFKAVEAIQSNLFMTDVIAHGETLNYVINIPMNARNFKATLVWTDPAATTNSNTALVNDIDLKVIDAQGTEHLPWILATSPSLTALESVATKGEDHLNNVEQVSINNPNAGTTTLRVSGFDISSISQNFALVYSWEEANSFNWNYPLVDDNFPYDGETASYFRWDSNFTNTNGTLTISFDNGLSWEPIASEVRLDNGYFLWTPPENISTRALLKMIIADKEFISDPFLIANVATVRVGINCEETVQLQWNKIENASAYNVYNLREDIMELQAVVTDTTYAFTKGRAIISNYFSVAPVFTDATKGVRSIAIDYEQLDAGCYESTLIAEISEDQKAGLLRLNLSSLFEVATIKIEKRIGERYQVIAELTNLATRTPTYLVEQPDQGLNTYRITTVLQNGDTYVSNEAELFFLTTTPFVIFPNPVVDGINIFTRNFSNPNQEVWIEIYSLEGRVMLRKQVNSDREFVLLDELSAGMYALVLYANSGEKLSQLIYKL